MQPAAGTTPRSCGANFDLSLFIFIFIFISILLFGFECQRLKMVLSINSKVLGLPLYSTALLRTAAICVLSQVLTKLQAVVPVCPCSNSLSLMRDLRSVTVGGRVAVPRELSCRRPCAACTDMLSSSSSSSSSSSNSSNKTHRHFPSFYSSLC